MKHRLLSDPASADDENGADDGDDDPAEFIDNAAAEIRKEQPNLTKEQAYLLACQRNPEAYHLMRLNR